MESSTAGGYRVERVLSTRLGVHTVVQAVGPDGGRVAITLLDPAVAADPQLRRHVLRLARTRAAIRHPNVLPLAGPREVEDRIGLVSALAGPFTLADRLENGPLEPAEAVSILSQVAGALETGAVSGLVHRDLAPASIVFDDGDPDRVFLGDFGVTVPPLPGCELVDAAQGIDYQSPEEVRGEALEPESNVYSLACLLVECLTGAPPYSYDRPLLTLHAHVVEPPPRVTARRPELPARLDHVISRGMAKDPRKRYRSPGRLMRAVAAALGVDATVQVLVPERTGEARPVRRPRPVPRPRRSRAGLRLGVAAPAVALCGLALGLVDWSEPPPAAERPSAAAAAQARQAAAVKQAVGELAARRVALRRRLADARRPAGQAAAARGLARAYRRGRGALPAAPAVAPVRASLRHTEAAYRRLGAAARRQDRSAWRAARRETLRREARLERALR
jgi:hypothetical protein